MTGSRLVSSGSGKELGFKQRFFGSRSDRILELGLSFYVSSSSWLDLLKKERPQGNLMHPNYTQ